MSDEDYARGYAEGYAAREQEMMGLEEVANYWYFRANNPGVKTADQKIIDSIIQGIEVREGRAKRFAELDAEEELMFNQARHLIKTTDLTDVQIAVRSGLFAPTVANIRAGVI